MAQQSRPFAQSACDGTSALAGWTAFEILRRGREIIRHEAAALATISDQLGESFCKAVEYLDNCRGCIVVCGMGKAGLVGQKVSATLCSTGTRSIFLHPAEAIHGDLGRLQTGDVLLMLSQSGETEEVVRLLPTIEDFDIPVIAITSSRTSTLGKAAAETLELGKLEEAGSNRLAPSTSTTAMMAIGDALALVISQLRGFGPEHFVRYHPGGSLGLKLSCVEDVMRPLAECRLAQQDHTVRDVFVEASRPGRRSGAIMLRDEQGKLTGIFTDSDLARLLEHRRDLSMDVPIRKVMNQSPTTIPVGTPLPEAVAVLAARKFSELPVVDAAGKPAGMLDITDVVGLLPSPATADAASIDPDAKTIPFNKP